MAYARIVQAGIKIDTYEYNKDYVSKRKRNYGRSKRRKTVDNQRLFTVQLRRHSSIQRAKKNFFNLVSTNLQGGEIPTFLTLTTYFDIDVAVAYVALQEFFRRLAKKHGKGFRFIAVPEWQKRGNIHFHALVWGLDPSVAETERSTRNIQRCWARGFCDVRPIEYNGLGIAGYMAKYLAKGLEDQRLANRRAYTCSRNVFRPTTYGSNSFIDQMADFIPIDYGIFKQKRYNVPYLGECIHTVYEQF